jgi:hypothetical protein
MSNRSMMGHHLRPWLGQPREPLACAHEQLNAQFILQLTDLAAHARLRGVQSLRHLGQVVAPTNGFTDRSQLLEIHGQGSKCVVCILINVAYELNNYFLLSF